MGHGKTLNDLGSNIFVTGKPKGEKEDHRKKKLKKNMAKSITNLMENINLQIKEMQQNQSASNMMKTTPMCIITKSPKT